VNVRALPRSLARVRREARRTSGWGGLLYVLPALLLLLLFEVWPVFFNLWISLWKWDVGPLNFVGLANYRRLFVEGFVAPDYTGELAIGEVLHSLIITVYYVLGTVPVTIFLAFGLAAILFRKLPGRGALRTIYFLPHVTSGAAIAIVFAWMFSTRAGVVNAVLQAVGLPTQRWLDDPVPFLKRLTEAAGLGTLPGLPDIVAGPSTALVVIILYTIWSSLGFNIIIYLAGLTAIPGDLYEAARIDGAGGATILRRITWPLLMPTTFFLLIYNTIGTFQAFTPIYTLTRGSSIGRGEAGGPLDTTLTITVYLFRNFYERANSVGYAAAVAFLLFFIMLGLTIVQFRVIGRRVQYQ
jgi:ABC-type sugar transport system permease subunit